MSTWEIVGWTVYGLGVLVLLVWIVIPFAVYMAVYSANLAKSMEYKRNWADHIELHRERLKLESNLALESSRRQEDVLKANQKMIDDMNRSFHERNERGFE